MTFISTDVWSCFGIIRVNRRQTGSAVHARGVDNKKPFPLSPLGLPVNIRIFEYSNELEV